MRARVQQLVQSFSNVYAYSRVAQLLLEHGLKSKVAKTRQGALDEFAALLKRYGIATCDPPKAFPQIAAMISDSDSFVRKSSLAALRWVSITSRRFGSDREKLTVKAMYSSERRSGPMSVNYHPRTKLNSKSGSDELLDPAVPIEVRRLHNQHKFLVSYLGSQDQAHPLPALFLELVAWRVPPVLLFYLHLGSLDQLHLPTYPDLLHLLPPTMVDPFLPPGPYEDLLLGRSCLDLLPQVVLADQSPSCPPD